MELSIFLQTFKRVLYLLKIVDYLRVVCRMKVMYLVS